MYIYFVYVHMFIHVCVCRKYMFERKNVVKKSTLTDMTAQQEKTAGMLLTFFLVFFSVKFTHQGHIRVSAECSTSYLSFSVSDTGIGIPQQKFKEIFEPFVKGDMSGTW